MKGRRRITATHAKVVFMTVVKFVPASAGDTTMTQI